jgi:hypothetical protein
MHYASIGITGNWLLADCCSHVLRIQSAVSISVKRVEHLQDVLNIVAFAEAQLREHEHHKFDLAHLQILASKCCNQCTT